MSGRALAALGAVALLAGGIAVVASPPAAVSGFAPSGGRAPATTAPAPAPAPAAPATGFAIRDAGVGPKRAYFAGRKVTVSFTVDAAAPLDLQIDVVREATRTPVRSIPLPAVVAGVPQRVEWDGVTGRGEVAPNGRYRMRVAGPGGSPRNAGTLTLHSHVYPIRGRHADRGPIGRFGVGRNGGRTHEGFDVHAPCGAPVVAARGGVVTRADYDPVLYGNLVIVRGERTRRDYWYAHLLRTPRLRVGDRVATGQRIGSIGATGNARTIGCQLHFELRPRGRPIDPASALHAWDRWS